MVPYVSPPDHVPLPGTRWRHTKGDTYTVITWARHTEAGDVLVIYEDRQGLRWARPLELFHRRFRPATEPAPA